MAKTLQRSAAMTAAAAEFAIAAVSAVAAAVDFASVAGSAVAVAA